VHDCRYVLYAEQLEPLQNDVVELHLHILVTESQYSPVETAHPLREPFNAGLHGVFDDWDVAQKEPFP
jgi:hypothetical protein